MLRPENSGTDKDRANGKSPVSNVWSTVLEIILKYNTVFVFMLMILIASVISDSFFTERNITNLLRQVSGVATITLGMLLVILTAGIDLSVGSVLALASVLSATFSQMMPLPLAIFLTLIVGLVAGAFSGYLVAMRNMAPFVVTLAMLSIGRGLAYMISKGSPIILSETGQALKEFGSGYFLQIPYPVYLLLGLFLIVAGVLRYTSFGRIVYGIGSNEAAIRLSGVRVWMYKLSVYAISGVLAAIAGIISTSRTGVGSPLVGQALELDAIAGVVIGGAALSGGKGTALNTLLGAITLGMIGNVMNLMNVPGYPQQVIKGAIIILAVLAQGFTEKRNT